MTAFKVHKR